MGEATTLALDAGTCAEIATGAMMPVNADAVIMVEHTQRLNAVEMEILSPVAVGENVVQVGEDVRAGEVILPAGHRLRPQDIAGLLGVGILTVNVTAIPRIAILSSGDELVPPEVEPALGQIRDINSDALAAMLASLGASVELLGIARDTLDDLLARAQDGLDRADMLVLTAGSSVSSRDLTCDVIEQLGKPGILQHGLAVKPGKPTILAVCDGKPVIGLPGNPVSALLVARQIVLPTVQRLLGESPRLSATITATLTHNIASQSGREDTIPVKLELRNGGYFAEPIFGKSNLIYTLIAADGVIEIPLDVGGLKQGTTVEVILI
jgi:molybdopterin molybdotransferase